MLPRKGGEGVCNLSLGEAKPCALGLEVEVRPRSKHLSASLRGCLSVHGTDCKRSTARMLRQEEGTTDWTSEETSTELF
ncbi:MAG: hypothetical protein JWM17_279 [Actinobacteria bacterium]|nr:hypothetical protein [Actinomycetota bacterium]